MVKLKLKLMEVVQEERCAMQGEACTTLKGATADFALKLLIHWQGVLWTLGVMVATCTATAWVCAREAARHRARGRRP